MTRTGRIGPGVTYSIEPDSRAALGAGWAEVMSAVNQAASFGTATSDNGALMYGHVPHVAPEAWFHILFPALDAGGLAQLETKLRRRIPDSYRALLKMTNGLYLFSGALSLDGLRMDYSRRSSIREPFDLGDPNVHERPRAADPSWFFFGFYKADGSGTYLDPADGRVYRGNPDMTQSRLNEWGSLDSFVRDEVRRLGSHFDERGRRLDPLRPTTPDF